MKEQFYIYPLSEKAVTIEVGNSISEENHTRVLSLKRFLQQLFIPGFIELVPAYCSITVYYDPLEVVEKIPESGNSVFNWMKHYLETELSSWSTAMPLHISTSIKEIPVCYADEFGLDLEEMAALHNSTKEAIIELHTTAAYRVYMMGFSPGFPYLGIVPEALITPRKNQPRIKVPAGSVAIAGNQTGIYPIESPGGWNIIGRTPVKLFDTTKENPFLLNTGDTVKFIPITKEQFIKWEK